jgi:pyruvate kinase
VVARHADIVGMSFAQSATDVRALRLRLAELGSAQLGLILKIETRRGFEQLPELLLAAMTGPAAGVDFSIVPPLPAGGEWPLPAPSAPSAISLPT